MDIDNDYHPNTNSYLHPPPISPNTVQGNRNVTIDEVFEEDDDEPGQVAGYDDSDEDDGWAQEEDDLEDELGQWDHGLDTDGVAPWLQGVSASDRLGAEFEAEAALRGTSFCFYSSSSDADRVCYEQAMLCLMTICEPSVHTTSRSTSTWVHGRTQSLRALSLSSQTYFLYNVCRLVSPSCLASNLYLITVA